MTDKRRILSVKWLAFLAVAMTVLPAQRPLPIAQDKIEIARLYTGMQQYGIAEAAYRETIAFYANNGDLEHWLETQRSTAKLWGDVMGQNYKALDYLNREVFPNILRAPATEAECYQHCLLLIRKASYEKNTGNFVALVEDLKQALSYIDHELKADHDDLAEYIFRELGNGYARLGETEGAENIFRKGIEYAIEHKAPDVALFNDYGSVFFSTQEYGRALEIFEKGLHFDGISEVDHGLLLLNKTESLAHLLRYKEALSLNQAAARYIANIDPSAERYERCEYGLLENYAIIYMALGDAGDASKFESAAENYRAAIKKVENVKPVPKREIAGFQISLGAVLEKQNKFQEALQLYQGSLLLLIHDLQKDPDFQTELEKQPAAEMLITENLLVPALEGKARCFVALDRLEKALECHELIPLVVAKLIATHDYESSSLKKLEEGRKRFDIAVGIAWQLFEKTGDRSFVERAFALTEQSRAVLLLQSIAKARRDFKLPLEIRQQEYDLENNSTLLVAKIAQQEELIAELDPVDSLEQANLENLKKELYDLKQEQQRFQDQLHKQFPDYANLSDQIEFLSTHGVANMLPENQALFDYYLTDTDVYIFYFNKKDTFSARKAALPPLFREQSLRFFQFMSTKNEDPKEKEWYLRMSHELYALLMQPELEADKNTPQSLMIIPDDALVFIPFDVLLMQAPDPKTKWRDLPFLLQRFSTGYAYSATLWDMQQKISEDHRNKPAPTYNFAGFAPSYDESAVPNDSTRGITIPKGLIYDIASTQEELNKVHDLMGGVAFHKGQTSEAKFKQIAPDCGILLLAMHGLANDEHPELSCLLFGMPKGDSINNDVLYANELQIMRLQADLAVLSACHTGFGKLHKGEGVYSLARAFAMAGVPSTVMSIWRLHERTAPILTEAFFKYLKAGYSKDKALQLAKIDFLANKVYYENTHPFYWAGVTVNGDMCPLGSSTKWYWLIAGMLVVVVAGWFRRRKRGFTT